MAKGIDLTRQSFGKWTVLLCVGKNKKGEWLWLCRCECGREKAISGCILRRGDSRGCMSCHIKRIHTKHGCCGTQIHNIWKQMIRRCESQNHKDYKYYGNRGIKVCSEWRRNFRIFRKWALANGYENGLTIDRIDNDGDYEPNNCQFLTRGENSRKGRLNYLEKIQEYPPGLLLPWEKIIKENRWPDV